MTAQVPGCANQSASAEVWARAVAAATPREDKATLEIDGQARTFTTVFISSFPCSGNDWLTDALNHHPDIWCGPTPVAASYASKYDQMFASQGGRPTLPDPTGGSGAYATVEDAARRHVLLAAASKQGVKTVCDIGERAVDPMHEGSWQFVMVRDGRDVLVDYTMRQLLTDGSAMRAYSQRPDFQTSGSVARLASLRRDLVANPDLFESCPHLLLSDEGWVRYAATQWSAQRKSDFNSQGGMNDDVTTWMTWLRYEDLRSPSTGHLGELLRCLSVDKAAAPWLRAHAHACDDARNRGRPAGAHRPGAIGQWRRYFTPQYSKWFRQETGWALYNDEYETDKKWQGDCRPSG